MTVNPNDPQPATDNARKSALSLAVQNEVVTGGRVETQGDYNAVVRFGKPINNTLHLLLTVFTLGLWGFVWIGMYAYAASQKKTVTLNVDEFGRLQRQQV